jgi:ABC-type spermidine/putrescine transport system permease subunit II
VFFVIPLIIVVPISLTGSSYLKFPPSSLSLRWFETILSEPQWRLAALHSLIVGVLAVVIALVVGLPVAFALARSKMSTHIKGIVLLISTLPVMVPPIVLALGVYVWYLEQHLLNSLPALALVQALLGLPFVIIIVMSALRDFDERLERAARSLGAGRLRTLRIITLPLIKRAIWAGVLFAFLQSFDELLIARAVTGVTTQTLPVVLWNGANEQISPGLGAVSVMLMAVTFVAFATATFARNRIGRVTR